MNLVLKNEVGMFFNSSWIKILKNSFLDCLRRKKAPLHSTKYQLLSKTILNQHIDKTGIKIPRGISSYSAIRSLFRKASPIILVSLLPKGSADDYCKGRTYYFSVPMDNGHDPGLYAVQVAGVYNKACAWVETVLYHGGCNITTFESMIGTLTGFIADRCYEMDYPQFTGNTIILSSVNNTALTITNQLRCVLNSFGDQCYDPNLKILAYLIAVPILIASAVIACSTILCIGSKVKKGLEYIGDALANRSARIRSEIIQDELLAYTNEDKQHFHSVHSPLLLIAQYANESLVPPNLRNISLHDFQNQGGNEIDQEDSTLEEIVHLQTPNNSTAATVHTPLLSIKY